MSRLPKIKQTIYTHKLVGLDREIQYRAFTNAEQKILLMAKDSKDEKEIINSVSQILNNCIITDIDIETLPTFDVEDIFLRIRAKSVGELLTSKYRYDYIKEGKKESQFIDVSINIDDIKVRIDKAHSNIIDLDGSLKAKLRYPTYKSMIESETSDDKDSSVLISTIDSLFTDEEVFNFEDYTQEEKVEFIDSLTTRNMLDIQDFLKNMPSIEHELKVETIDGIKTIKFKGLVDFFI